jgi:hypothetical protein
MFTTTFGYLFVGDAFKYAGGEKVKEQLNPSTA